jgi:transcriptional regulator with XRE-family HTH domain
MGISRIKDDMVHANLHFRGEFTPELRAEFRRKRLELGMSQEQLANHFSINWSTVRKWESGQTATCHDRYIFRINDFLTGEMDRELSARQDMPGELLTIWNRMPPGMRSCIERAATLYGLCQHYPGLGEVLLENVNADLDHAIHKLLRTTKFAPPSIVGMPSLARARK